MSNKGRLDSFLGYISHGNQSFGFHRISFVVAMIESFDGNLNE
jgi:hypothetical protein